MFKQIFVGHNLLVFNPVRDVRVILLLDINPLTGDQTYLYNLMYGNWMHEQISIDFQKDFE